jgi:hypothetical protein
MKLMWKNQCPDMIDSTAPSPLELLAKERAKLRRRVRPEGVANDFKKIHKRPTSNHKLIYICLPDNYRHITKSYL